MSENPDEPLAVSSQKRFPTAKEVQNFHQNADTDLRKESIHHTIGTSPNNAASGSHRHDGSDSARLLDGATLVGSRGGNTALTSVIALLVQLGATDSTTS